MPLPLDIRHTAQVGPGDFTLLNSRWSTSHSYTMHESLQENSSEWHLYHTLYREDRECWPELPIVYIAMHLRSRSELKVGDFGCEECLLKAALPQRDVIELDNGAVDDSVIACDMAHSPLEEGCGPSSSLCPS